MRLAAISQYLLGLAAASPLVERSAHLTVKTQSGLVTGILNDTVREFLKVPYVQPPLGNLRFLPPQPINSSTAKVDATKYGPACTQHENSNNALFHEDVSEFQIIDNPPSSEDCLNLAIWTPGNATTTSNVPVIVFVHGGGLSTGGIDTPYQIPREWVKRTQSHIVVVMQYRLGIFGFPQTSALKENNLGLLDQRAAMEWVRCNIAAFGGDTSKITLWGQSGGSVSVDLMNFAYPTDPIYAGTISDSGSAFVVRGADLAAEVLNSTTDNWDLTAYGVGCHQANNSMAQLNCMRQVSASKINTYLSDYQAAGTKPAISFRPVIDNQTVFLNYTDRYRTGMVAKTPGIYGNNAQDGVSFLPFNQTTGVNETTADYITELVFQCPAADSAKLSAAIGRKTYLYNYRGNFTNVSPQGFLGAYHSSELPQVFGTNNISRGANSALETATSQAMQDRWLAFMNNPQNPTGWDAYTSGQLIVFGNQTSNKAVSSTGTAAFEAVCANISLSNLPSGVNL